MKKIILLVIVISSLTGNAQSLKDLLYSGKLKNDSGSVVRKGDDLSSKIDTTTKKKAAEAKVAAGTVRDSSAAPGTNAGVSTDVVSTPDAAAGNNTVPAAATPKDNNTIWKEYIDSLSTTLQAEVIPNKKIKSGTYYVFVEYEIDVNGQVAIKTVAPSPDNSFLKDQITERLTLTAPQMSPLIYNGKPRKSVKKYTFNLTKL